ncbi:MAG: nucleotidyl transferase AbiEii/AbiGii toxin family protein [Planctomycetes bacterium]|nr:nucleotidyl transferase AbiEii/AbiGii toxin family protein [Planctomycetota bacterium]
MKLGAEEIQRHAASLGFRPDALEKVFRLLSLLETLRSNAFLRPRVALKGGTALNLFLFDLPRLSVDIDLNYVGPIDRATMLAEKPKVEQAIQAVCARESLTVKRMPIEHAGGKWRLAFTNTAGSSDKLEIDVNFILRVPLWPVSSVDSRAVGPASAKQIALLDRHELAAGKLAALCSRSASRDLFDGHELLCRTDLDPAKLRLAFVVYGGINRRDWRTVRVEDIGADARDLERELVPMLRADLSPARANVASWAETLVRETRDLMSLVLPLVDREREFLERLNGAGDIVPELLTDDPVMRAIIRDNPGLKWKALKVKKGSGLKAGEEPPA